VIGGGGVGGCRVVRLSLGVDRDSLVRHIGDVTVVVIGGVLDVLGPAVGESNRVTAGNVTGGISGLGSVELGLGVVISNTVLKGVWGRLFLLNIGGGVAVGGGVVHRGGMGNHGCGVHGVGNNGGVVRGRGMVDNGGVVRGRGMVDNRGVVRSRSVVHDGSGVVGSRGMVHNRGVIRSRGMISGGSVVRRGGIAGNGSGSVDSSNGLLVVSITMDRLRSGVGLASYAGVGSAMGLVQ